MTHFHTSHQVVCFGEILWDILPKATLPGGAPMNVAYHLKMLGNDPCLISRIGMDDNGNRLKEILVEKGINTSYLQTDPILPTGIVVAKPDENNEVTYDIVQPVAWDSIQWDDRFFSLLTESEYFVCGSLAARSETSRDTLFSLLDMAKTKVVDINLRPPHFSRVNNEYLLKKADILKLNLSELELISTWYGVYEDDQSRIKSIQDKFDIKTIIVTMGGNGAMVMQNGILYSHNGYPVKVADTVGSGDAFLAGFIHQLLKSAPVESALAFACSIGALVASYSGACPRYNTYEINELMHSNEKTSR
ncbi:carbohydrate kinase family protein [Daejeonella oryzae]|uniref:carbohydrate kinase family protein n=1 Tax=Daejeonella oryzae TaxID=1122943 RepID=UPI0003FD38E0|nr:carbohydrate kinase [Daejeonella oryzae]